MDGALKLQKMKCSNSQKASKCHSCESNFSQKSRTNEPVAIVNEWKKPSKVSILCGLWIKFFKHISRVHEMIYEMKNSGKIVLFMLII